MTGPRARRLLCALCVGTGLWPSSADAAQAPSVSLGLHVSDSKDMRRGLGLRALFEPPPLHGYAGLLVTVDRFFPEFVDYSQVQAAVVFGAGALGGVFQPYAGGGVQAGLVAVELDEADPSEFIGFFRRNRHTRLEWGFQAVAGARFAPGRRLFAEARWGWRGGDRLIFSAGVLF